MVDADAAGGRLFSRNVNTYVSERGGFFRTRLFSNIGAKQVLNGACDLSALSGIRGARYARPLPLPAPPPPRSIAPLSRHARSAGVAWRMRCWLICWLRALRAGAYVNRINDMRAKCGSS